MHVEQDLGPSAVILEKSMGGLGTARNRFVVPARQATQPSGIGSLGSILGRLKSLKIRALGAFLREVMDIERRPILCGGPRYY